MINTISEYLEQLKAELAGNDPATVQDALSDAEEYLRNALENKQKAEPGLAEADALPSIIEEFGSPPEFAEEYKQIEEHIRPSLSRPDQGDQKRTAYDRFFGIIADPKA